MIYDVQVRGLGGPMGEFCGRSYQVEADTYGQAVDKAVVAANEDFDKMASKYADPKPNRYHLYSLTVNEAMQTIRRI